MIVVYTGNGKGKTSACLGQVVRALGRNLRTGFVQFMKEPECAGEQRILQELLGDNFFVGGKGFFRKEEDRPLHRAAAECALAWAIERLSILDVIVLDESLYALRSELLTQEEIEHFLEKAQGEDCHVILSGRDAPEWLIACADLVTDMGEVKHPWAKGLTATEGIDF